MIVYIAECVSTKTWGVYVDRRDRCPEAVLWAHVHSECTGWSTVAADDVRITVCARTSSKDAPLAALTIFVDQLRRRGRAGLVNLRVAHRPVKWILANLTEGGEPLDAAGQLLGTPNARWTDLGSASAALTVYRGVDAQGRVHVGAARGVTRAARGLVDVHTAVVDDRRAARRLVWTWAAAAVLGRARLADDAVYGRPAADLVRTWRLLACPTPAAVGAELARGTPCVYEVRLGGRPVYVGSTRRPLPVRLDAHRRDPRSPLHPLLAVHPPAAWTVTVLEECPSREAALVAEFVWTHRRLAEGWALLNSQAGVHNLAGRADAARRNLARARGMRTSTASDAARVREGRFTSPATLAKRAGAGHGKGRAVRCVETGCTYPSLTAAALAAGVSQALVSDAVNHGRPAGHLPDGTWLHWRVVDGSGRGRGVSVHRGRHLLAPDGRRFASLAAARRVESLTAAGLRRRMAAEGWRWVPAVRVLCASTGEGFADVQAAAEACGLVAADVHRAACVGGRCGGLAWRLVWAVDDGLLGGVHRPLVCLETGDLYAGAVEFARVHGAAVSTVVAHARSGRPVGIDGRLHTLRPVDDQTLARLRAEAGVKGISSP